MADWIPTDEGMPPEGVVVEVITPGGEFLRLKWHNRLWLFADGSIYLYFTPAWWREAGPAGGEPRCAHHPDHEPGRRPSVCAGPYLVGRVS